MLRRLMPAIVPIIWLAAASSLHAQPLTAALTYQGELADGGSPAAGTYDFRFLLFNAATAGTQQGSTVCADNVSVVGGRFTATLDFGSQFAGQQRFLEVWVRPDTGLGCPNGTGFTILTTRQALTAAPHATFAVSASSAVSTTLLNGQAASFYLTADNLGGTLADARLTTNIPRLNAASTFTATPAFNGGTTGVSPPFSVDSTFRVTGLNADLIDGLDSTAFSLAAHTHAHASLTGLSADDHPQYFNQARGDVRYAQLAAANALTAPLSITAPNQSLLSLSSSNVSGAFHNLSNTTTGGRTWNLVSTGSASTEGTGKFLIRDGGAAAVRMTFDTTGNVGIGTSNPAAKLDVNGVIRSGGIGFPDGSTQFRAASTSPIIASGLPAGTTFVVTVGGGAASLAGSYTVSHPTLFQTGSYQFVGAFQPTGPITVRRTRTTNQQWVDWVATSQQFAFSMTLTVPGGGGGTVTWTSNARMSAVRLVRAGVVMEEADILVESVHLNRNSSGGTAGSSPGTDLEGVDFLLNGAVLANTVATGAVVGMSVPFDVVSGTATGPPRGSTFRLRTNPLSSPALRTNFVNGTIQPGTINGGGGAFKTSNRALISAYILRLADDGLPIEEYDLVMDP